MCFGNRPSLLSVSVLTCRDCRAKVARDAVLHDPVGDERVLDHVVHHDLAHVDDARAGDVGEGACIGERRRRREGLLLIR